MVPLARAFGVFTVFVYPLVLAQICVLMMNPYWVATIQTDTLKRTLLCFVRVTSTARFGNRPLNFDWYKQRQRGLTEHFISKLRVLAR